PRLVAVAAADEPAEDLVACPEADDVLVPPPAADECPPTWGVGAWVDGTEDPPVVQAETTTATRTAPAAERPAISHAPWAATVGLRRTLMNPPRMRVR
ncbi:MAG: hypothetical protein ACRDNS_18230, partial [Trebonia sp.]